MSSSFEPPGILEFWVLMSWSLWLSFAFQFFLTEDLSFVVALVVGFVTLGFLLVLSLALLVVRVWEELLFVDLDPLFC